VKVTTLAFTQCFHKVGVDLPFNWAMDNFLYMPRAERFCQRTLPLGK